MVCINWSLKVGHILQVFLVYHGLHDITDMQELATQLQEARDAPTKVIVSDGVFSMDGSITPLK